MLLVMNMVIMSQVHHLSTEKEGENLKISSESTLIDTNQSYPIRELQDINVLGRFFQL